ncbi:MAG: hypothetical protein HY000_19900 [Planctomycetes bacterium]|nr:hypothetical protein [Planctomycetota bacterium]
MKAIIPPLCLFLGLAMFCAAFAVAAVEQPEATVEYHRARVSGDDEFGDLLEAQLERRQFARKVLLGSLIAGGVAMTATAFVAMRG